MRTKREFASEGPSRLLQSHSQQRAPLGKLSVVHHECSIQQEQERLFWSFPLVRYQFEIAMSSRLPFPRLRLQVSSVGQTRAYALKEDSNIDAKRSSTDCSERLFVSVGANPY